MTPSWDPAFGPASLSSPWESCSSRHAAAAEHLAVDDVLVDRMRGRSSTWTRIRVNLQNVPESLRPPQEKPDPDDDPTFDDNALYEIRRIEHFRRHHGVNRRALPLLCELWREIDRLKSELRFLRGP